MIHPEDFFTPGSELYRSLFEGTEYVWEGIANIKKCIQSLINPNISLIKRNGPVVAETYEYENGAKVYAGAYLMSEDIEIGPGALIEPGALINGPAVIGAGTQVRHGAYIRGNVISGENCVIGHATEMKHSVMLGESKAGHFAYIGDSILGSVNLGAGTKLANLKLVPSHVILNIDGREYSTGLKKFGAVMGDGCQTGCNSVTAPGTLLSRNVIIYPNSSARGFIRGGSILKLRQNTEISERTK